MNMAQREKIEKIKQHFRDNKKVYIAIGTTAVVTAAGAVLLVKYNNVKVTQKASQNALVNYKPTIHQEQIVQVIIPPRGNSGNAIQCDQTHVIFPSQNFGAKDMGLNPSELSKHLNGLKDSVNGFTFTKLTENGIPLAE